MTSFGVIESFLIRQEASGSLRIILGESAEKGHSFSRLKYIVRENITDNSSYHSLVCQRRRVTFWRQKRLTYSFTGVLPPLARASRVLRYSCARSQAINSHDLGRHTTLSDALRPDNNRE